MVVWRRWWGWIGVRVVLPLAQHQILLLLMLAKDADSIL
jgi:hypothetical protein